MKNKKFKIIKVLSKSGSMMVCLSLLIALLSCEDFTDTPAPSSQLFGKDLFEDRMTANAAISSLYSKLRDTGILTGDMNGLGAKLAFYADELDYYQISSPNNFYTNSLFAAEPGILDIWQHSYSQIYVANAIIEGVTQSQSLPQSDREQLKGEALFVRALIHFYLVNLYSDIPYIVTTDYQQNKRVNRLGTQEVYDRVLLDLNQAISLIPDAYISPARTRPNKSAAYALLARVYLYTGQWTEAAETSSAVINNSLYSWENDIDKVFLKESTSTIWQFSPSSSSGNTVEAELYIFNEGPPPFAALSNGFITSFEHGDLRKARWTRAITDGTQTWHHAYKYKENQATNISIELPIVLRLAEQYLIRAEARVRQGDIIGAQQDINKIRFRAGLPDTVAATEELLLQIILEERRHELFTEYGHRFFDLKRLGLLHSTLPLTKPGWETTDSFWPIPMQELIANPNLNPQNDGY